MQETTNKTKHYYFAVGIIISNALILTYLISSDTLLVNRGFGLLFSFGIFITIVIIVLKTTHDYENLILLAVGSLMVLVTVLSLLPYQIDYYSDCSKLSHIDSISVNDCINYMNENPGSTGAQVVEALAIEPKPKPEISILEKELLP